jgi:hypothetical protein
MFRPLKFAPSSNVESMGYDGAKMKLLVRFKTGSNFVYSGVDEETADGLAEAESAGKYLHKHISSKQPGIPIDRDGNPI